MLWLKISTNVSLEGVDTSSIRSEATSTIADIINKPKSIVKIVLDGSISKSVISFGGSEPSAYAELVSTGSHNPDRNNRLGVAIASLFGRQLSIPTSRFFIKFYETKDEDLLNVLTVLFEDVVVNGEQSANIPVVTTEVREGESELDDTDDGEQSEQHPLQELSIPPRPNTREPPTRGEPEIENEPNEESATESLQHRVEGVSITPRRSTRLRDKSRAPTPAPARVRKVFKTRKHNVKKGKTSDARRVAPQTTGETILSLAQEASTGIVHSAMERTIVPELVSPTMEGEVNEHNAGIEMEGRNRLAGADIGQKEPLADDVDIESEEIIFDEADSVAEESNPLAGADTGLKTLDSQLTFQPLKKKSVAGAQQESNANTPVINQEFVNAVSALEEVISSSQLEECKKTCAEWPRNLFSYRMVLILMQVAMKSIAMSTALKSSKGKEVVDHEIQDTPPANWFNCRKDPVLEINQFITKEYVEKLRPSSSAELANTMHNMIIEALIELILLRTCYEDMRKRNVLTDDPPES